jgi:hypothetical protein
MIVVPSVALAVVTAACTSNPPRGSGSTASTVAADSPWQGGFVPAALPPPVNSLGAVSCPTATRCVAVGQTVGVDGAPNGAAVVASSTGGASWSDAVVPPTVGFLSDVSCVDARRCVAVGQSGQAGSGVGTIITSTNGGTTWIAQAVPAGAGDVTTVSCLADGRCVALATSAVGAVVLVSSGSGVLWSQDGVLPPGMSGATAVSCTDDRHCWVTARTMPDPDRVAGTVAFTVDGGAHWTPSPLPSGTGFLNGVACQSSTTAPTGTGGPGVSGVDCVVVGTTSSTLDAVRTGRGVVLTSANGGGSWTSETVSAFAAALTDVSCTAPGSCVAVGASVAGLPEAGLSILTGNDTGTPTSVWKGAAVVGSPQALTSVSCVSTSACVAVGESTSLHLAGG